jgi:hypothetical protein
MSLSGKPCSCGGRNKNCAKCDGSGLAPGGASRSRRGRKGATGPSDIVQGGFVSAPRRGEVSTPRSRSTIPTTKYRCEVCGRKVAEQGRAHHAEAAHYPQAPRGMGPLKAESPRAAPNASPGFGRKLAKRREPPSQ